MKRKRTNLKRYLKDRLIYGIESQHKRNCRKFLESMSNPVCSVSFRLNGVPIENYGLEVINAHELIKEQFIKKTMPSDFNHFDKDLFGLMFGYGKIQIINKDEVYKISPHPTTP